MAVSREERKQAYLGKAAAELEGLAARGVIAGGNAFSELLFLRGSAAGAEAGAGAGAGAAGAGAAGAGAGAAGATAAVGPFEDGERKALRASLERLGYPPECWLWALTCDDAGAPLDAGLLREAVATLDPATVVAVDNAAANALRNAYVEELAQLGALEQAILVPGVVAHVLGMRMMALGDFAAALGDAHAKQVAWARLKQLPPLGEPY